MKHIKIYENFLEDLLFGNKRFDSFEKIHKIMLNSTNELSIAIINNNYKDFKKNLNRIIDVKKSIVNIEKFENDVEITAEMTAKKLVVKAQMLKLKAKIESMLKYLGLDAENPDGDTALLIASSEGRLKMVKDLIKAGANINHKNKAGEDFYDMAINRFKFINNVKDWIEKTYPEWILARKFNI